MKALLWKDLRGAYAYAWSATAHPSTGGHLTETIPANGIRSALHAFDILGEGLDEAGIETVCVPVGWTASDALHEYNRLVDRKQAGHSVTQEDVEIAWETYYILSEAEQSAL
jgi:hypothetical protein